MAATTIATTWQPDDVVNFFASSDMSAKYGFAVKLHSTEGQVALCGADEQPIGVIVKPALTTATDGTAPVGVVLAGSGRIVEVVQSASVEDGLQIGLAASGKAKGDPGDGKPVLGLSLTTTGGNGEYQKVALTTGQTIGA